MTTYLVGTLARYVLVDAANPVEAEQRGAPLLETMYEELRRRHSLAAPVVIRTVRPATHAEIELDRAHRDNLAREAAQRA